MFSVQLPWSGTRLLDWLLKYCRLCLISSCFTITFDLCEVWPALPSMIASGGHKILSERNKKILSIHLHSSLQKQAPHYWPLVLFRLKTLILLLPPQSTSSVFCAAASKFLGLLGKDHKQTQYLVVSSRILGSTVIKNNELLVKYSIDKVCS